MIKKLALAAAIAAALNGSAAAQTSTPGLPIVPLGNCQLTATQLNASIGLASCVSASFTATAGTPATQMVVTSVTGFIKIGDAVISGTGATIGSTVVSQISGTPGGAGTYVLSAVNTTSSATVTTGGIPTGATAAFLQAETADVRWRDDGGAPTASIGNMVVHGAGGQLFYAGTLSALRFIALSGSPLLDVAFYR